MTVARYAQLADPYTTNTFEEWASDFSDIYNNIPVEKVFGDGDDSWRPWVQNIYINGSFPAAPGDSAFSNWRDWAAAFIEAQIE